LLHNIPELKYVTISIELHKMESSTIVPDLGKKICASEGFEEIGPKKLGKRIIIPLENREISETFGAKEYLVIDKNGGGILQKEIIENPFFEKNAPHGARFIKAVSADKIVTKEIGPNARANLESFNIEIELTDKSLDNILKNL
jgi:predicted Fe-Mo cluster-binding NifX family protein